MRGDLRTSGSEDPRPLVALTREARSQGDGRVRSRTPKVEGTSRIDCIEGVAEVEYDGFRFRAGQEALLRPWGQTVPIKVDVLEDLQHINRGSATTRPAVWLSLRWRLRAGRSGSRSDQVPGSSRWSGLTAEGWSVVAEEGERLCDPTDHAHGTVVVENTITSQRLYYRGVRSRDLWEIQYLAEATGVSTSPASSSETLPC